MDVSKQINLSTRSATASPLHTEALQPVALEKLALIPGQTYEARVIVKASAEILQTLSANLNPTATPAKPDQSAINEAPDSLWLLRVQGKILLAELPANPRSGNTPNSTITPGGTFNPRDKLWLQLRSDGSLAFRPAPKAQTTLSPALIGNLTPLLELTKAKIEQHLARTLHQQQPVSSVLTQLNPQNQTHTKPEIQALLQQVMDVLRAKVPSRDLFELLNTPTTPALARQAPALLDTINIQIARTLQHYLDKQGLTFERTLLRTMTESGTTRSFTPQSLMPQSFTTTPTDTAPKTETSTSGVPAPATQVAPNAKHLGPLKTLLQRFGTDPVATPPSSSASSSSTSTPAPATTPMPQGDLSRPLQFNTAQALTKAIHQTEATSPSSTPASSSIQMNPLTTPGNLISPPASHDDADLKGTLLGLIKTLSQGLQAEDQTASKPLAGSATQDNLQLLANPLAFPRPMLPPAMLKANAMLAEEELSTGQILRLLAGLLHRIQFNQLNSLHQTASNSSDNVTTQSWMFDLPILNNSTQQFDFFQLRMDREKHHAPQGGPEEKTKTQWKVALSFNFDGLGQINIHLRLLPPTATSVIWATQANTLQLLKKHAEHLRERLGLLGLTLQDIQYQEGAPATESRPIQASIVDTRA